MQAEAAFNAFYCKKVREILPCLSGQETKVFWAICTYCDAQGKCWPGVRELADVTTYPPQAVCDLLDNLQDKRLVVVLRKAGRDPLTGKLVPDVYAVNPEYLLVPDRSVWDALSLDAYTNRNSSIPESVFPVKSAQADRSTEADTENQMQRSITTAPEGAAMLQKANTPDVATRSRQTRSENGGANSTAGSANAQNSPAQRQTIPPGSGASPLRNLSFQESLAANAIKKQVSDMSIDTVSSLIIRYGVDRVNAAVTSYMGRKKNGNIKRPTGWIIKNLESGAKRP